MNFDFYFPYEFYRNEQKEVIKEIYESLQKRQNILFIAPSGTGKTIDNLVAAIPIAKDYGLKIIYLCRTHQQSDRVISEVKKINEKLSQNIKKDSTLIEIGIESEKTLLIRAISIRGRAEMCLNRIIKKLKGFSPVDIMNICADLRKNKNCSYFNQMIQFKQTLNEDLHILSLLTIESSELINFCNQKKYCPYFFTKLLLKYMDIIVCNYQWVFNPDIKETLLEGAEIELNKIILIMDECHNLSEMANEIESYRLTKYSIEQAVKELKLYEASDEIIKAIKAWTEIIEFFETKIRNEEDELELDSESVLKNYMKKANISDLNKLNQIIKDCYDYGFAIYTEKIAQGLNPIDFIGIVLGFIQKFLKVMNDNRYFIAAVPNLTKNKEILVNLEIICMDPRIITQPIYSSVFATISCSGTIHPDSFIKLIGLDEIQRQLKILELNSPFPKENILVLITKNVNTKGENRLDSMYKKIIEKIAEVLFSTPANIGIFCASYVVLNGLLDNGLKEIVKFSKKKLFIEDPQMSSVENSEMIRDFKSESKYEGAVLLGVCGGRNSEGEDFPGDYMNSVIIVGVPFQKPTPRIQAKIRYYNSIFNNKGYFFGYIIPAMQRSNQAAGRPIRKLDDRGAIILMDERFIQFKSLLSNWILQNIKIIPDTPNAISNELNNFFKNLKIKNT